MGKKNKISVVHYLDTRLKPVVERGIEKYPVYVRVGYKGQNTKFKSKYIDGHFSNEEFNKLNLAITGRFLNLEKEEILIVIGFLKPDENHAFKLKGLAEYYDAYTSASSNFHQKLVKDALKEEIKSSSLDGLEKIINWDLSVPEIGAGLTIPFFEDFHFRDTIFMGTGEFNLIKTLTLDAALYNILIDRTMSADQAIESKKLINELLTRIAGFEQKLSLNYNPSQLITNILNHYHNFLLTAELYFR
jgi:hypothetical protein